MKRIGCFFICFFLFLSIQTSYAIEVSDVESEFVYIYNVDNQEVIYEKNAQDKLYPASMTKIMTTLVALENMQDLQEMITMTPEVFQGLAEQNASVAGFVVGEHVVIEDLLYGVMLPSGADATRALALHISGSEDAFVDLMNEKAKSLQLTMTHFVNTSGLHQDAHYTSAKEMAIILQEALKNETFKTLFSTDTYTTTPTNIHPSGLSLVSTKLKLMKNANLENNILSGGKTGFTLEGGLCLASTLEMNRASYIVITANAGQLVESAQHIRDTYTLSTYLKTTYTNDEIFKAGNVVGTAKVILGKQNGVQAIVKEDVNIFKHKQDAVHYEVELDDFFAPIQEGEEIGVLKLFREQEIYKEIPLYANQSVERNTMLILTICAGILLLLGGLVVKIRSIQKRHK